MYVTSSSEIRTYTDDGDDDVKDVKCTLFTNECKLNSYESS